MKSKANGFSLIELLIVVGVLVLLMVLAVPAFNAITQGSGMKRAIAGVSESVELARTEAMAKSTWVWLGLADTTQDNAGKLPQVTVVVVASRDGTTNTAAANLIQLIKPVRVENVKMLAAPSKWATNAEVVKNGSYQFSTTIAGVSKTFSSTVIGFSPQGEALLDSSKISPWLEIGLREMKGAKEIEDKEASVRVSGISGQVLVTY